VGSDAVVEPIALVTIVGVGGTADMSIEIAWLSLKNATPVFSSRSA
jgi:hypothetical protein